MNKFLKSCVVTLIAAGASSTWAESLKFEVLSPSVQASPVYPGLDLGQINKIDFSIERNIFPPEDSIRSMKIDFQNAADLTVSNINYDVSLGRYTGVINGAWVFKQVGVEISTPPQFGSDQNVSVRLYVIENQNFVNGSEMNYGLDLVTTNGLLMNTTPNPVIDSTNLSYEGKNLNLKLYQRADRVITPTVFGEGFRLDTRWFGNGDRTIIIPAPFNINDPSYKAVAIQLETINLPDGLVDHMIAIVYEDFAGSRQTTPMVRLQDLLNPVYPAAQ